ncbi:MAG: hypothetical protein NTX64_03220 [Elusimicrobia bacterium]|nr:hypothetical protein [Elusimicrobiota bacterium]
MMNPFFVAALAGLLAVPPAAAQDDTKRKAADAMSELDEMENPQPKPAERPAPAPKPKPAPAVKKAPAPKPAPPIVKPAAEEEEADAEPQAAPKPKSKPEEAAPVRQADRKPTEVPKEPQQVVAAFLAALQDKDFAKALACTGPAFQKNVPDDQIKEFADELAKRGRGTYSPSEAGKTKDGRILTIGRLRFIGGNSLEISGVLKDGKIASLRSGL